MTSFKHVGLTEYPTDGDDGSPDVTDRTGGDVFSFCCECPTAAASPNPFGSSGGMASGVVEVSNFAMYKTAAGTGLGTILVNGVNVLDLALGFTGRLIETLNGATTDTGALGPSNPLNHAQICAGALCSTDTRLTVNDSFSVFSSKNPTPNDPADAKFSYSDQKGSGGIFSGGIVGNPALISCGAATVCNPGDTGASSATTTLTDQWTWINDASVVRRIDFSANEYVEAWMVGPAGAFVSASIAVTVTIVDNTSSATIMIWTPLGTGTTGMAGGVILLDPFSLNSTVLLTTPILAGMNFTGSALGTKNSAGTFRCQKPVMTAGHTFTTTLVVTVTNTITGV